MAISEGYSPFISFILDGPTNAQGKETPSLVVNDKEDCQPTSNAAGLLKLHHPFSHISFKRAATGDDEARHGPHATRQMPHSSVHRVYACQSDQTEVARQNQTGGRRRSRNSFATWPSRIGGLPNTRPHRADDGIPDKQAIKQIRNGVRLPVFEAWLHLLAKDGIGRGNTQRKAPLRCMRNRMESKSHGVLVDHYHADNGIFKAQAFVDACRQEGQGLTFAGVGAHHQNGIAECCIRELQDLARTMLIHANRQWPKCVDAYLWPYAVQMAAGVLNETPSLQDAQHRSPLQLFGNTKVAVNSTTTSHSDAPCTSLTAPCSPSYLSISGSSNGGSEYIWDDRLYTVRTWH